MRLSTANFFASSTIISAAVLMTNPSTTVPINAFVPIVTPSSSFHQQRRKSSSSKCMSLFYTMPDVSTMNPTEMRDELMSYGISTGTLIDKREYEEALREARRHYEQTLSDVMASTRPKKKKKQQQQKQQQQKRRTVNYNRETHQDERIYTSDVNLNDHEERFETAFGHHPSQQEQEVQRQRYQQQQRRRQQQQQQQPRQQQQQRRPRHYRASPDPMGPDSAFHQQFNTATATGAGSTGAGTNTRVRPPPQARQRATSSPFERDPLSAHEELHARQRGENFYGYNTDDDQDHHHQQQHYEEYHVGSGRWTSSYRRNQQQQQYHYRQQQHPPPPPRGACKDPAAERKYQTALMEAYNMKVEDLQKELNVRGISTKYCMVFKDFCHEYAKAIAENKQKVVIKVTRPGDGEGQIGIEEDDEGMPSSFVDDQDYDPSYRDVVMQKYDPSMWI